MAAVPMVFIGLVALVMSDGASRNDGSVIITRAAAVTLGRPVAARPWDGLSCDSLDVAIDGTTMHLLIGSNVATASGGKSARFYHTRSDDGGGTWSPLVVVSDQSRQPVPHHRGADARIIARGRQLFAAWTTPGTGFKGTGPMGTALSADGGKTWRAGPDPADHQSTGSHRFLALTAEHHAFHLVWLDDRNKQRGLRHASSTDGGKTWSANATIDDLTCACCWNTIIHLPAPRESDSIAAANSGSPATSDPGTLLALYRDMKPSDMGLARSTDGGKTWRKLGHVGEFNWFFDGCPHVGGGIASSESTTGQRKLFATIWSGSPATADSPGHIGCHLFASEDHGETWLPLRRLGSDTARHPTVAAQGEKICIAWDDLIDDDRATFAITSADGGRTWSKPVRLSTTGTQGSHARIIASPAGDGFVVMWTESTENEANLKMQRLQAERSQAAPTPVAQND